MKVSAPLAGWALPLSDVPDEVFAAGMAGDGVAIDPTGDVVCAPFDGEIVPVGDARHAVTVRARSPFARPTASRSWSMWGSTRSRSAARASSCW